jgi:hypothetical protein
MRSSRSRPRERRPYVEMTPSSAPFGTRDNFGDGSEEILGSPRDYGSQLVEGRLIP